MSQKVKVAVIAGGPSNESAVSLASAQGVLGALASAGFEARIVELTPKLPAELASGCDVAFPVAHGPLGEDGCLQGLLEVLGIPYVGSDVRASAIAAHKPTAKIQFRTASLPVAAESVITRTALDTGLADAVRQIREALGAAVVVKPVSGGSAIGVSRLSAESQPNDLEAALRLALDNDVAALVERFHSGFEVTCAVLDLENGPVALPPTLIQAEAANWYDFQSRYKPGGSRHECPAPFEATRVKRIQELAITAHQAVCARDLSRVDFVVEPEGEVIVLEVNTLPGMTATSLYPEAAAVAGIPFPELCRRLVEQAIARPRRVVPSVMPMPE